MTKKRGRRDLCSQGFCVVADKNLPAEYQCRALWTCFWINYLHLDGNPQKRIRGESDDKLAPARDYFGEAEEILGLLHLFALAHSGINWQLEARLPAFHKKAEEFDKNLNPASFRRVNRPL